MIYDNYAELVEVERKYVDTNERIQFQFLLISYICMSLLAPSSAAHMVPGNGVTKIIIYVTAIGYLCKQWKNALWEQREERKCRRSVYELMLFFIFSIIYCINLGSFDAEKMRTSDSFRPVFLFSRTRGTRLKEGI